jgi:hypothetical protein
VAGVTVALAGESLWSARQDRAREAEYLEQLRVDLAENRVRLEAAIGDEETIGAAARTTLNALRRGERISADSARSWLIEQRAVYYSDPRLLTGTFSGLVESGDLRLVRDPEIRKAILSYLPQVEADRAEFDRWVDRYIAGIAPYRVAVQSLPGPPPSMAEAQVAVFSASPVDPLAIGVLDSAMWTNEVRLIYLRRMLEATDATAEFLSPD